MKGYESLLDAARRDVRERTASEVDAAAGPAAIIDCREPEEWRGGVIAGALRIPRGALELRVESLLPDRNRPVLVYCASGVRSLLTAQTLMQLGYRDVSSLTGGIEGWKAAGKPIAGCDAEPALDRERYQAQMRLPEIGETGQAKLRRAKVLVIGAGGLGSPAMLYLAAAGIGTIGVVDDDCVDRSNLQRQILHTTDRIGLPKVDSAFIALRALNSDVSIARYRQRLNREFALEVCPDYDLVMDGTDNFETRYVLNRVCREMGKPLVHGSVYQWQGQVATFYPNGPCYECLFPEPPSRQLAPNCAEGGVFGAIAGLVGSAMACEAIKALCGLNPEVTAGLTLFDIKMLGGTRLSFEADPECTCCGIKRDDATQGLGPLSPICAPRR